MEAVRKIFLNSPATKIDISELISNLNKLRKSKRELVTIQLAHMYATVRMEKFLAKMATHVSLIIVQCKIFRLVFIL